VHEVRPVLLVQHVQPLCNIRRHDNIKMDLKETGCQCVNWIRMVQDVVQWRDFVSMAINPRVKRVCNGWNFLTSWATVGFSGRQCSIMMVRSLNTIHTLTIHVTQHLGMLISLWLFLFAAQPKECFLDGLKKLEQRSHKCVEVRGEYVE
jgi:hypothetical protein